MKSDGFDWDAGNLAKCRKHGVSIAEIEWALTHDPVVAPDIAHSISEQRWIAIGRNQAQRAMYVAFTLRTRQGQIFTRPVSARYMHAKEQKRYAQSAYKSSGDDDR